MSQLRGKIQLKSERIDDLPLLWGLLEQLRLGELLDARLGHHHLHKGLSNGQLACVWLAFVLSEGDHRKVALQPWALNRQHTLEVLLRQPLREVECSDDRLGLLLRRLARADWPALETGLWQAACLVYEFQVTSVRLDATTASGYHRPTQHGLMQRGHSKDHRPDLAQLKLMGAAAQPHGHLLACDITSGEKADDPLYTPLIKRVRQLLDRRGLLYVGDCKMAALATRAELVAAGDYYLTILPLTGEARTQLPTWIETALANRQKIVPLSCQRHDQTNELGEGYEWQRRCQATVGEETVNWQERVQLIRIGSIVKSQQKNLEARLSRAEAKVRALTPKPGKGRRAYREEAALRTAVTQVLEDEDVTGLMAVQWEKRTEERERYVGPGRGGPKRNRVLEVKVRYEVTAVKRNQKEIEALQERLGWRVQVTNVPAKKLPLAQCVRTYREGWSLERDFHLVKDKPLGISPLYVKKDEQILGLTRLLTIGLRALTWLEIRVREELRKRKEELVGLYAGQANRATASPTAVMLLRAISRSELTLTHVSTPTDQGWHLTALPLLLLQVLDVLGLPSSLYLDLVN